MIRCNSIIKINTQRLRELSQAQVTALEKTAEALHTEVVQAQVMPFDTGNLQNDNTFVDYTYSKDCIYNAICQKVIFSSGIQFPDI